MQIGMIGLGRMGGNMVRRLAKMGHQCVVFDMQTSAISACIQPSITGATSLKDLVSQLKRPRVIWLMLPAAAVEENLNLLTPLLTAGDIVIDGGNSYYHDDIRRGIEMKARNIHYVDVGTSGGVAGLERGYCLMIGGDRDVVHYLAPLFSALAPGAFAAPTTVGRKKNNTDPEKTADQGYLHCGAHGAGHFVKMVHNGIEYGIMAAYAEGLNILRHANSNRAKTSLDLGGIVESPPLRHPEYYQYEFNLPEIAELWRRGSVIGSWLLDLTASALLTDPALDKFSGQVPDTGEGRWTIMAALDEAVPAPVLSAALYERFTSRGEAEFANKVVSAMRYGFGGHSETAAKAPKQDK